MTNPYGLEIERDLAAVRDQLERYERMLEAAGDFESGAFERAREAFWANAVPAPRARERSPSAGSPPVGLRPLSRGAA